MIRHYENDRATGRCRNCGKVLAAHHGLAGEIGRCDPAEAERAGVHVTREMAGKQLEDLVVDGYDRACLRIVPADELTPIDRTPTGARLRSTGWRVIFVSAELEEWWRI